jgi:hypothetical protein
LLIENTKQLNTMMIKQTVLLFNVIGLLIYKLFFAETVAVTVNAPASTSAGKEITVEVNVSKGGTTGFAKLQQDLPPGCNATVVDAAGGNFSYADGTVKVIWMSLPPSANYKVVYKLTVAADGSVGQIPLAGKFSYLENNEKKTLTIPTTTVAVSGGSGGNAPAPAATATPATTTTEPATTATTPATTPDASASAAPALAPAPSATAAAPSAGAGAKQVGTQGNVTVTRDMPASAGSDFTVTLTIKKPGISGFAKMEEILPTGLVATNVESASGVFSFVDGKVKFLWMSLPPGDEFKISYKVAVKPAFTGTTASIDGTFSFLENDATQKAIIPASGITLGGGGAATTAAVTPPKQTDVKPADTPVADATPKPTKEPKAPKTPKAPKNDGGGAASSTGIVYKVQICATHKSVPNTYFKENWSVADAVGSEQHEGWYKYTTGNYSKYAQAKNKRVELTGNAQIPGPFVSAYNSGSRITVQEALMISNQQWAQ